ncbi:immunoglobulin domain-containing protein oig-1-like [Mytilus californianus]|uniref:immunoglobulin domain-containing protein oig-1-like n=1 Tax=Mytilus californianus TaxID=6549 RepID=UPI0022465C9B|nr:immunoglobulin domain-containing protein oig-1-like [Mytilus californianus]
MENAAVCVGHTAYFLCDINGDPLPDYEWFHDGMTLNNTTRFNMRRNSKYSRLRIINTKTTDSGEYTCKAFNAAAVLTTSGRLRVTTDC